MKSLGITLSKDKSKPLYQRLSDAIRNSIREGRLKPGEPLPSTRDLAARLGVNRHTIMAALHELQAEGWITSSEKKSYWVNSELPDKFLQPRQTLQTSAPTTPRLKWNRRVEISEVRYSRNYKYGFPSGMPDLRLFPMRELKSHLYDAMQDPRLLAYGPAEGHLPLMEEVATYLRRVRGVDNREIVITHGSQEAIFLIAQLLLGPGDAVLVEALGYPPAIEALRFSGAKLVPVPIDSEGMDIEELRTAIETHKVKMIYLTPLHQYPTMATYSAGRRLALYELAQKNGILILEDDYDHEFHYISQPVAPMASFDPAGIVLYVSTFSKILFPSARIGFMAVPKPVGTEVARLKRISSRQNEHLMQNAIARWMKSGGFEAHLRRMRRTYHSRRDAIVADLQKWQKKYPALQFVEPDGGMAIWMNIGIDSRKFSDRADKASLLVQPEQSYRLDSRGGTHLRLGFAGQTESENRIAMAELFRLLG